MHSIHGKDRADSQCALNLLQDIPHERLACLNAALQMIGEESEGPHKVSLIDMCIPFDVSNSKGVQDLAKHCINSPHAM